MNKKTLIFLIIFIVLIILIIAGSFIVWNLFRPTDINAKPINFEIKPKTTTLEIANDLKNTGLIKSKWIFIGYLKLPLLGSRSKTIKAGVYQLQKSENLIEITKKLTSGEISEWIVTFPEGFGIKDIAARLQEKGIVKKEVFLNETSLISKYQNNFEFLKGITSPNLEGYLFPDTYHFYYDVTSEEIIKKMLENFKNKTSNKPVDYQVITIASIVEREAQKPEDRAKIASVYLNRLDKGIKLEADPTVQYAKGSWDKITSLDYKIDSPYNTYKYTGLPPGPICNPGLDSIMAVLNPEKTNYFYFFHNKEGQAIFSLTNEEHEQKKQKYLK